MISQRELADECAAPVPADLPRFAVVHWGARLHYALPQALAADGMLACLYTDAFSESTAASLLKRLPSALLPKRLRRVLARVVPDNVDRRKIRTFPQLTIQDRLYHRTHRRTYASARDYWRAGIGPHQMARELVKRDFEGATALYAHPCSATDAILAARDRGMLVVYETISMPLHKRIERAEHERFGRVASWSLSEQEDNIAFFCEEMAAADLILAPSRHVAEGLRQLGAPPEKIALVPYGLDISFRAEAGRPTIGRALYVGNITYLKGVPHFAAAARMARERGLNLEMRAVGSDPLGLRSRAEFRGPRYVGHISRADVQSEFLSADVMVFPTLSDGFGIVLLEAMAAGVPVISTANCGDVVVDGVNGFIVPTGDAQAILDRVVLVTSDRQLRARLSDGARETALRFGVDQYRQRLTSAVQTAVSQKRARHL